MTWPVRPCASPGEMRAAYAAISHYVGRPHPGDDQLDRVRHVLPLDRVHAAWDGADVVGGAGAFPFELTVPGGRVRAAGVTIVGVQPTHRRRGVLTAMMRAQLDDCRARGEPVAYLWASEEPIYGRFGYGLGSLAGEIDLSRDHSAFQASPPNAGSVRLVATTDAEAHVSAVYERVAASTPGMFARTSAWWQRRVFDDPPWRRAGGGELTCAVVDVGGAPGGYGLYRIHSTFERGIATGFVNVIEAIGDSPAATSAIWRYLLDLDWTARVTARYLPIDHPLFLLLAEPRRLAFTIRDGLWVRLIDVGTALAARSYAADESIAIDVADAFCPWNAGVWRVCRDGAERAAGPADLSCDVAALGSVYLGGFTWGQLSRGHRVDELRPGAIARADRLFATSCAPWCPEMF